MTQTQYPTIRNSNFESLDAEDACAPIHDARLAVDGNLTDDSDLIGALDNLEVALEDEVTESGELRRGAVSEEILETAEGEVLAAWTDAVQEDVLAEQQSRYRD